MGIYPCIDEYRRYRSYPCSQCQATECLFGSKPEPRVQVKLVPGQKACLACGSAYQAYGKSKYRSDACRRKAVTRQRRRCLG